MKIKIEKVVEGTYGYDSIIVTIDKMKTDIVFDAKYNVKQYEGKYVDLSNENGIFKIKEIKASENIK
ncbi:hypothetical protein FYJ38_12710 [Clostridium sp. WB02_MRS01]|uniref:hypothetical protein n=1 Tax=Clostridium sp. WB02_MRS01 TaxID=2605777 RepID=UPI0012B1BC62|nr:hypothetical protein [Clostridium sp. WB02_MRS01]MSS09500.1 hypothetical protein [Clostridium sp. WB02_MRS01]